MVAKFRKRTRQTLDMDNLLRSKMTRVIIGRQRMCLNPLVAVFLQTLYTYFARDRIERVPSVSVFQEHSPYQRMNEFGGRKACAFELFKGFFAEWLSVNGEPTQEFCSVFLVLEPRENASKEVHFQLSN